MGNVGDIIKARICSEKTGFSFFIIIFFPAFQYRLFAAAFLLTETDVIVRSTVHERASTYVQYILDHSGISTLY